MVIGAGALVGAGLGAGLGALGGVFASRDQTQFRRRQRKAIGEARKFADQSVERITGGKLFKGAQEFIEQSFTQDSPIARDARLGIRAAQSVRGTFTGNLANFQESLHSSVVQQRFRESLLPQALQFATVPEQIRQSIFAFETPLRVAAKTGALVQGLGSGPNMSSALAAGFSGAVSGGLGGAQIGAAVQSSLAATRAADAQTKASQEFAARLQSLRSFAPPQGGFYGGFGSENALLARLQALGGVV